MDLLVRVLGDEVLGELPAAPTGAHAEYALGPGVEHRVGLLLGAEGGQGLAQPLGRRLARTAGHRLRDLGTEATSGQQAVPARAQVLGGPFADLLGPEPADHREDHRRTRVPGPEAGEGHADEEDHGEGAEGDQERGAEGAGALVRLLGDHGPELEDQQPHQQPGQEQHTTQHHDGRQPVVPLPADAVRREAVLDDDLRLGAEGLDEGLRPAPSMRSTTARPKASPRLGLKIVAHLRPELTVDSCHWLFALRISPTSLSRYAAEARAKVAAVCPAEPESGTCAPGVKSKPSNATSAPIAAAPAPATFPTSCPAHLLIRSSS